MCRNWQEYACKMTEGTASKCAADTPDRHYVTAYQQEMAGLHAVQLVDIFEELATWVILQQVLTLFIFVDFFRNRWMNAVVLS